MISGFTPFHRGGVGPPLVCLHGFMDTWRTWELVLPALELRHDVLAPTLVGHAGGPPAGAHPTLDDLVDAVEAAMDGAGFGRAHLVGNSLGGYLALRLAARGRALSVVALAPAGGWRVGDRRLLEVVEQQRAIHAQTRAFAPRAAEELLRSAEARRRATSAITCRYEHIPPELIDHLTRGVAACRVDALAEGAVAAVWPLDAERVDCPVRIVWGTEDALLPWPDAASRYLHEWLPHADWVVLEGVGHSPQLDVPTETAQLILGHTG